MNEGSDALTFGAAFEKTLRLSRFAQRVATAHPELVAELEARGAAPFALAEMTAALASGPAHSALRSLRRRVMFKLAHRDLNGLASLDEVFDTMTGLAEVSIRKAVEEAHAKAVQLFGEPRASDGGKLELIVAALGKLGGGELNVSSDIDLVFLYGEEGETGGPKPVSHSEFFAHVGRGVIALLSEITGEGQAFRVDMRLRPFGDSGPLVHSLASLDDYFVAHARPWERYAWLKARVVSGPAEPLEALVTPFVYRRYLDYGLLASLRELHTRIFETAIQRRKADDIKVGAGGIREVEFCVQLLQLVRGGRDTGLQISSTRDALAALAERGLINAARARALADAYAFLRRLEHRLQYYDDQQTQALPRDETHRALIAQSMGFADPAALLEALDRHRAAVQEAFNALFEGTASRPHTHRASIAAWLNDPQATPEAQGLAEDLAEAGIDSARAVAERLIAFTRSRRYRAMSATARGKMDRLVPEAVIAAADSGGSAATVTRLLGLLETIDRRDAYLSLLIEYPNVLLRAARLVSKSAWAARLLTRHPILLDELTHTAASFTTTDWAEERRALEAECSAHAEDTERLLDTLRHFKQRHMLRLTIADLEGELPVMALSDALSALADTVLDVTLGLASHALGPGPSLQGEACGVTGFAVVGYGKLGGKELGYGSDLDIIFLYDPARADEWEQLARLAQRINSWLTSLTPAGVLYETDLRLRPDGASGLLVSSIDAFREYQQKRAWTWEHQALTRARFCAGDRALGETFERVRDEVLATPREPAKLYADIVAMRRKMRAENKAGAKDLKHIDGGVIDLEFCLQALVLAHGPEHPPLRENKGNHTLLNRAGQFGLIDPAVASAAADAYLEFRRRLHVAALNDEETVLVEGDDLHAERAAVRRLWSAVFAL